MGMIKFAIPLQHLNPFMTEAVIFLYDNGIRHESVKKEVRNGVHFLHVDR